MSYVYKYIYITCVYVICIYVYFNIYIQIYASISVKRIQKFVKETCFLFIFTTQHIHTLVSSYISYIYIHLSNRIYYNHLKEWNHWHFLIFETSDLKLTPVIDGPKCPTRKLSQLIDLLLKPFLKHIKIFICDSLDFLINCPRDVDVDTEVVKFAIISLYQSIPHKFGLEALDYFLTKYQEDLYPRFKNKLVLESFNFVLKSNDSEFYLQIKEAIMGTIFASTYSNLTMGYHEIKVYSIIRQSHTLANKYF